MIKFHLIILQVEVAMEKEKLRSDKEAVMKRKTQNYIFKRQAEVYLLIECSKSQINVFYYFKNMLTAAIR